MGSAIGRIFRAMSKLVNSKAQIQLTAFAFLHLQVVNEENAWQIPSHNSSQGVPPDAKPRKATVVHATLGQDRDVVAVQHVCGGSHGHDLRRRHLRDVWDGRGAGE